MNLTRALSIGVIVVSASGYKVEAQPAPAAPLEPVTAVLEALRSHRVVGLGLGAHNNEQGHRFLLSLVSHPDLPGLAADLVVECGNSRYQHVMDRFVAGENVPYQSLRRTWEDTTQPHAGCDVPLHEELYRAVRTANAARPIEQAVRVLLGDPPVDWDSPSLKQDRGKAMAMRDSHPAAIIQRDILAKGRRALVVYGQMHLQRKQLATNYDMSSPLAHTIVSLLERAGIRVFAIWGNTRADLDAIQPGVASWPRPALALTRGTAFGAADFDLFYASPMNRVTVTEGKMTPVPREQWRVLRMEDQFDAVLYLGPPSTITVSQLAPSLCRDANYMKMRLGRIEREGPRFLAHELRQHCARVASQSR